MGDGMNLYISLYSGTGRVNAREDTSQMSIEKDKNKSGLANLKQGQKIIGTVLSVEEETVTLDFDGHKVRTSKEMLKTAIPGERKTFEVVRASNTELELRLTGGTVVGQRKSMRAVMIPDKDWETLKAQKNQSPGYVEKEQLTQEIINKLQEINTKFTENDCASLEEEGFLMESLPVKGLYEAIDRVKTKAIDRMQSENTAGANAIGKITDKDLAALLTEENLPATIQNISNINKALALSETAAELDDKAMKYLIAKELQPTIENIYKAFYSDSTKTREKKQELTEEAWLELETQVNTVIKNAGYEVNEANLTDARWLIENKLPLTEKTFSYKKELEELKRNTDKEGTLHNIIEGLKNGIAPGDVSLVQTRDVDLNKILSDISSISGEAVTYAVRTNTQLTIKRLITIEESMAAGKLRMEALTEASEISQSQVEEPVIEESDQVIPTIEEAKEIKAQRQLEEIRLKMTLEAARKMERKGISIETQELEKVVEELRRLEDSYYSKLLREAEVPVTGEAVQTLRSTTDCINQLRLAPSYVLGSTLMQSNTQTISSLALEGSRLQAELVKAGAAYEALATVPNQEYGDSLRKAFANMDSLLSELKIEETEENRRAVRILAYNQMEITEDHMNQVKAYDKEVTTLINHLHPAVTVRMIKEGINPLNTPIGQLNDEIDRMKEEQGINAEDKFSTYLQKLERNNEISADERKAYIGIYRLLYNVERSEGAALGSVIKAGREVTLSNLLTAVQTGKKGRLDAVINDEFGTLSELSRTKESIAEQLGAFKLDNSGQQEQNQEAQREGQLEEQTKYLSRILKQITEDISPENMNRMQMNVLQSQAAALTQDQKQSVVNTTQDRSNVWESIKDIPLEKLLSQLENTEESPNLSKELYSNKVEQLRQLSQNSEQSIRFLNDYQITCTPQSIMLANHVLSNGVSPIAKLLKQKKENSIENSKTGLKEFEDLSDKLIEKSSINEAYEALEANAKTVLKEACSQETIDSRKLAELKTMGQQLTFLRTLASKEYYQIPIETEKGITNINLTILRGSSTAGRVSISVKSEQLGDIKAEFSFKDQTLKGFISGDSALGLEKLKSNVDELTKAADEHKVILKQMDFALKPRENEAYSYQNPEDGEATALAGNETEKKLYRIAKAFVQMVRIAESGDGSIQRAVS